MSVFTSSITHPNEFSVITGKTQLIKEIPSIEQSIRLLLTTAKGELFGDPAFGCNLYSYLFEYEGKVLNQLIKDDIVETLTRQDSRVSVSEEDIDIVEEDRFLRITVRYKVRYSNYSSSTTILVQKRKEEDY